MIGRILAMAIGLLSGLASAQMPEFAQQYRQRLGGAVDELRRVVARFDETARTNGVSRADALKRLTDDSSPIVKDQGRLTEEVIARLDRLETQRRQFEAAGSFQRLLYFVRDADPGLARATYLDYEPAWPATQEGLIMGGAGFLTGWGLLLFLSRITRRLNPFRRRQPSLRSA